jgi:hypothetical protein
VHDLAGVEDDGLAAGFAVMSRKAAIRVLEGKLPVDHAMRAADQIGAFKSVGGFDEGLDDIASGFGISRQPAILEAPAGRYTALVGSPVAHVLRKAEPVERRSEMGLVVMCRPLRSSGQILENEADVPRLPRLIPVRKQDQVGKSPMRRV